MILGEQLGKALAAQRQRAGLSQEELADRAEMHRTAISLLETGKRVPRLGTIASVAAALDISPVTLVAGIDWQRQ